MNITLYVNSSENQRMTKTLTYVGAFSFSFKDESSVFNPQVLIAVGSSLADVNYAYISQWGRYYYVTEIQVVRTGLFLLKLHGDVLMTWKDQILNCSAVIKRQQNQYNLYLDDPEFKIYNQERVEIYNFSGGFNKALEYILTVAG